MKDTKRSKRVKDRFFIIQPTSPAPKAAKVAERNTPRRVEANKKNRRIANKASGFTQQINDIMGEMYK